ncbi:four helix bundle protein [Robertkochia sediminum]|uniref:four helix bundle protein n=1 Tax=Robertkochia sediminum TaxID=2785326 RepID=UPI001931FD9E|nr:four helix bundle protein [Robertkochia sediminum]MBL7473749.1 four helix bundle protein [Robertkochia sediminum]
MRNFRKYEVWKRSHALTLKIYQLTSLLPNSEKYQLISQMQRAAYSIPSNFSEGCGRASDKDFNRFIHIALGSAHELEYFLILTTDLKFLESAQTNILLDEVNHIKSQLYNLSKKL